jgi:ribosomal protein S19
MDKDVRKMLEKNQSLLRKNLEISRSNEKKIKKIQSHIRRTMVAKYVYWIILIGVTVSALYLSKPYINEVIDTYNNFRSTVDQSSEIFNNPGNLFHEVNIIQRVFGS